MNILKNNKGTTLIELLVALSAFAIIMLSVLVIFRIVIEDQRNAISSQNVQEGLRYALEMMGKEIRSAQLSDASCRPFGESNRVFNTSGSDTALHFINKDGDCVIYALNNERLEVVRGANTGFLTSANLRINNMSFTVSDNDLSVPPGSRIQPKVAIKINVESNLGKEENKQTMEIQTTISSRLYE